MGKFKNIYMDDGGKWLREVTKNCYHMIEFTDVTNYKDFTDNYIMDLSEIDLDMITEKNFESAKQSCGWEDMDLSNPEAIAEMLHSYGLEAPLGEWTGNNWHKMLKEAKKFSYELSSDPEKHHEMLNRSVNAIGSTAIEFMQGDFNSAMLRGISNNNPAAKIMGKMHGITDETMEKLKGTESKVTMLRFKTQLVGLPSSVPSKDPIPYVMGFMAAINSSVMEDKNDLAQAYIDGYKYGVSVRLGENPWPTWAK